MLARPAPGAGSVRTALRTTGASALAPWALGPPWQGRGPRPWLRARCAARHGRLCASALRHALQHAPHGSVSDLGEFCIADAVRTDADGTERLEAVPAPQLERKGAAPVHQENVEKVNWHALQNNRVKSIKSTVDLLR